MTVTTLAKSGSGTVTRAQKTTGLSCAVPISALNRTYLSIQTTEGEKPIPYHRILLITYDGEITFENLKIRGLAYQLIEESQHRI